MTSHSAFPCRQQDNGWCTVRR